MQKDEEVNFLAHQLIDWIFLYIMEIFLDLLRLQSNSSETSFMRLESTSLGENKKPFMYQSTKQT